nr:14439_t:CDS:2 [Entrophospora candida]
MINNNIKNLYSQILLGETNDPTTIDLIFNYFNSNPNYYFEKYYLPEKQGATGAKNLDILQNIEEIFLKTKLTAIYDSDDSHSIHSVPYDFDIYDD